MTIRALLVSWNTPVMTVFLLLLTAHLLGKTGLGVLIAKPDVSVAEGLSSVGVLVLVLVLAGFGFESCGIVFLQGLDIFL